MASQRAKKKRKKRGARETSGERTGALSSSDSLRVFNACLVPVWTFHISTVLRAWAVSAVLMGLVRLGLPRWSWPVCELGLRRPCVRVVGLDKDIIDLLVRSPPHIWRPAAREQPRSRHLSLPMATETPPRRYRRLRKACDLSTDNSAAPSIRFPRPPLLLVFPFYYLFFF